MNRLIGRPAYAGAVLLLTTAAYAQTPLVSGDAYLQSGTNASQNFGALANVLVGPGTGTTQNRGLVQFDLSGLSGLTGTDVQKAIVWVYVNRVTVGGAIDVYDVTTSWSEGTATWNSPPVPGALLGSTAVTTANQWVGVDITTEVQTWLTTSSQNHGLELQAFTQPNTSLQLDAKENVSTSHPAQLQIILNGPAGATGPAGPQGAPGATGPTGATGAQGSSGPAGNSGPAGPSGAAGPSGPAGPSGATGNTGATGATGVQGPAGPSGAQGLTGNTGATGATGPSGANGNTVLNGTGAPSNSLGVDGDYYIRNDTSCLYGPKAGGAWPGVCVSIVGPSGPAGPSGAAGPSGPAGNSGPAGPSGAAGPSGPAGNSGPSGSSGAAGPSGPSGPTGVGASGPSGPSGPRGASGPSGPSGPAGSQGNTGAAGPSGPSGANGAAGAFSTGGINPNNSTTFYMTLSGDNQGTTLNPEFGGAMPIACTFKTLTLSVHTLSGSTSNTVQATLFKNGSATSMLVAFSSLPSAGSTSTSTDSTAGHQFSVAAGDFVSIEIQHSNTSTPIYRFGVGATCQ